MTLHDRPFRTSTLAVSKLVMSSGMLSSRCCGSDRLSAESCSSLHWSRLLDDVRPVSMSLAATDWWSTDWWADTPTCWQQLQIVEWYSLRPSSTCDSACLALSRCLTYTHRQQSRSHRPAHCGVTGTTHWRQSSQTYPLEKSPWVG